MSCVPLPWCTSMSMIATRSIPGSSSARAAATDARGGGDFLDHCLRVDEPQLVEGCVARCDLRHLPEQATFLEVRHDGAQAVGPLGVAGKLVLEIERVIDVADASGHGATHRIRGRLAPARIGAQ